MRLTCVIYVSCFAHVRRDSSYDMHHMQAIYINTGNCAPFLAVASVVVVVVVDVVVVAIDVRIREQGKDTGSRAMGFLCVQYLLQYSVSQRLCRDGSLLFSIGSSSKGLWSWSPLKQRKSERDSFFSVQKPFLCLFCSSFSLFRLILLRPPLSGCGMQMAFCSCRSEGT